jgi:hypothetical protein
MFQAAVIDAVGRIVKLTSEQPPTYLVKLSFSFPVALAKSRSPPNAFTATSEMATLQRRLF